MTTLDKLRRLVPLIALFASLATASTAALATPKEDIAAKRQEAVAAKARIDELGAQIEPAIERYNQAQSQLAEVRANIAQNTREIGITRANIAASQKLLSERLVAAYRTGDTDAVSAIIGAGSIEGMIETANYLRRSQADLASLLSGLATNRRSLEARRQTLKRDQARQAELTQQAKDAKDQIESSLAEQQRLYTGLKTQIDQLEAQEAARQERLRQEAERALAAEKARAAAAAEAAQTPDIGGSADPGSSSGGGGDPGSSGGSTGSGSGGGSDPGDTAPSMVAPTDGSLGARAVEVAMQYLGVPYVWGGSSPGGFDCSGLTMFAYAAVGVSLSHFTGAQWNEGTHVSRDQLMAGDLVFFGSDIHHVGMYIGGGQFIHAPHTGDVVKISDLGSRSDYAGAVRPY